MHKKSRTIFIAASLAVFLSGASALACTWAAFANGGVAVVARTMDWYCSDNAVAKGHGRNVPERAADTPDGVEYEAKYASIRMHAFASGMVTEAMNEKGLQGSILFLDGSELPAAQPGRKDVKPTRFISYAVANFATVRELVDALPALNFTPDHMSIPGAGGVTLDYPLEKWPGHFAFADATGDKAIIEFVGGEVKVYHGREHDAMTNEPTYDIHRALDDIGYQPNGTISTVDRRMRAKHYLRDMRERGVATSARALLALRGLIASVYAGTEEIDRSENEVYPTVWSSLADQKAGRYYVSRYDTWCAEIYDFDMFSPEKAEVAVLEAAGCPYAKIASGE